MFLKRKINFNGNHPHQTAVDLITVIALQSLRGFFVKSSKIRKIKTRERYFGELENTP